ncbi:ATP-binding cassette domain-containing protein [Candidatus Gracilibacteria bacterium]|nr:ATP-binding cassette domain-containing protein [Candidatus Gracilibacteria bacterium]
MNNEILRLENVSLSYDNGKTYVLKDISFGLLSGEILSIIGVNGTGKTSLLKVIAGILSPSQGKLLKKYKKLSYVPQKINLDDSFPILVEEYIEIYNEKIGLKKIKDILHKFNSEYLLGKKINKLSGGELQKVLIVTALLSKPDLMLLDEPTAGIDIIGEEIFYKLIKEVKEYFPELSIVLVSHNIHLVYKNSQKVICLHENNFCCHGTPAEIGNNPTIKNIFGEYILPYRHNPHPHDKHNKT